MPTIEVLNPVASKYTGMTVRPAPRLDTLNGKTIGLYWNQKSGGDVVLSRVSELIRQRFPDVSFRNYTGSIGWGRTVASDEDVDRIAEECQGVIGTTAD